MKKIFSLLFFLCFVVYGYTQTIDNNSTVLLLTPGKNVDDSRTKLKSLNGAKAIGQLYNKNNEFVIVIPSKDQSVVKKTKKEIAKIFPDATIKEESVEEVNRLLEEQKGK